jgi:hypothetical protein
MFLGALGATGPLFAQVGPMPKSLTPAAIFAVRDINKELTPRGDLGAALRSVTIHMVNGGLMANRAFSVT